MITKEKLEQLIIDWDVETILCSYKTQRDLFEKYWPMGKVLATNIANDNVLIVKYLIENK